MAHTDHARPARSEDAADAAETRTKHHAHRNAAKNRAERRTRGRHASRAAAINLSITTGA